MIKTQFFGNYLVANFLSISSPLHLKTLIHPISVQNSWCIAFAYCSLEHMVTSLKSPSQTTNMQHVSSNNSSLNNNANKNSLQSEFHQPQQHQLQIQINGGDTKPQQRRSSVDQQTVGKLVSPPKGVKASQVTLSTAGPITDL